MRIVVLGSTGMLGRYVVAETTARGHDVVTPRVRLSAYTKAYANELSPDVVINCAGLILQKSCNPYEHIQTNALGPHIIARAFDFCRVVHISTDCVFRGSILGIRHCIASIPDAIDVYGRTKALGEVVAEHVTNVRTSFIGYGHGLLVWLIKNRGTTIQGYTNALWSGSSVYEVAKGVLTIAEHPSEYNIEHLSTQKAITKYDLIQHLVQRLEIPYKNVLPTSTPVLNRALIPTRILPPIEQAQLW